MASSVTRPRAPASSKRPSVLLEFAERRLQALERIPHAALHGVLRRLHDRCDLFERQVRYLAEQEHLALIVRQLVDRGKDPGANFARDHGALDARFHVRGTLAEGRAVRPLGMRTAL